MLSDEYVWIQWHVYAKRIGGGPFHTRGEGKFFLPNQIKKIVQQENIIFFSLWSKNRQFFSWDVTDNFFYQDMFKGLINCETGMRGTVTCRYKIQLERDIEPMLF